MSNLDLIRAELSFLVRRQWAIYMALGLMTMIAIGAFLNLQYGNNWAWVVEIAILAAYLLGYSQRRDIQMRMIRQHLANIRFQQRGHQINFPYLHEILRSLDRLTEDATRICQDDCYCPCCKASHQELADRPADPSLHEADCAVAIAHQLLSGKWVKPREHATNKGD